MIGQPVQILDQERAMGLFAGGAQHASPGAQLQAEDIAMRAPEIADGASGLDPKRRRNRHCGKPIV